MLACELVQGFLWFPEAEAARTPLLSPTQPWSIVFYTDEASPGNLLRVDNTSKSHAFYFSFSEFGAEALSKEFNCFCFCRGAEEQIAAKVKGGLSGVFKSLMQLWFSQDQNFHNTGVTYNFDKG